MARRRITAGPSWFGPASHPSLNVPELATQTFKEGAIIDWDATGFAKEASADPRSILGVAEDPGHNAATDGLKSLRLMPALAGLVFEGSMDKASALGYLLLATDIGGTYGLTKDANGIWYIDKDKVTVGTNTAVHIIGNRDALGTASARVYFVFANAVLFNAL